MAKIDLSPKRLQIDKANAAILIAVSVAAFVVTFSVVAGRSLLQKRSFQSKIIEHKTAANNQLKDNLKKTEALVNSYKEFVGKPENVLGGNSTGQGERDGDNAKIVLDALPSKYDFPALTTSLEKILADRNYKINSITGTDDEVAQSANQTSATPVPVEIPFQLVVGTNNDAFEDLLKTLEKSIRPIQIKSLSLTGSNNELQVTISGRTFYQPEKNLTITQKEIKQ